MNKEYKTIDQIEKETTNKIFYPTFSYVRSVALANFLRNMEIRYRGSFWLLSARPQITYNRGRSMDRIAVEKMDRNFTFGLWCRFAVDSVEYYLQMNENPFFDAYIIKSGRESSSPMNDILYDGVFPNVKYISKMEGNIHKAFQLVRDGEWFSYKSKNTERKVEKKQVIYSY